VPLYRLFFLNPEAGNTDIAEIQCDSDEKAIAEARRRADGGRVVIWCGGRCVGAFEGSGN